MRPALRNGELITVADRSRRVLAVTGFLTDITEWGWPEAPARKLLFRDDNPKLPQVLPRYLPVDADRQLTGELRDRPGNELAACALRLQRSCGLRIGELLDLELDCVHEMPGHGSWLKIPLGKLETERMVPLDDDILQLIDRITEVRSHGRPMPHPRYRRKAQFLFTHHGRRLGQNAVRAELDRAADAAGLGHVTSHQLRHTYATALVNAGVSLQSLMALLGHASAEMSLRYGRLFDTDRPRRVRTGPRPRQDPSPHPLHRADQPAPDRHHRRRRLEGHPADQVQAGRRVLPASPSPGRMHLRQHLRALPQLPRRGKLPASPGRSARRRPGPGPGRPEQRLDHRSRPAPQAHRPARHPDQPGPGQMKRTTSTSTSTLSRVDRACAQLRHNGNAVTFTAVAASTGLSRTTLYRNPGLRAVIEDHRHRAAASGTLTGLTDELATLRTALDAVADRVRHHEEQLRKLTARSS